MSKVMDSSATDNITFNDILSDIGMDKESCYFNFHNEVKGSTQTPQIVELIQNREKLTYWNDLLEKNTLSNLGVFVLDEQRLHNIINFPCYRNVTAETFPKIIIWEQSKNQLSQSRIDKSVESKIHRLLDLIDDEEFETEIDIYIDNFSKIVIENAESSISTIANLIDKREIGTSLIHKILRLIGSIKNENTHNDRFNLLLKCLANENALVRDGAVIGLSFMDDKIAIPYLIEAVSKEAVSILKKNIEATIADLQTS